MCVTRSTQKRWASRRTLPHDERYGRKYSAGTALASYADAGDSLDVSSTARMADNAILSLINEIPGYQDTPLPDVPVISTGWTSPIGANK
jgi:hypothetical protein